LLAGLQFQFADRVGGDESGDALVADGEHDLGRQAVNFDFKDGTDKLVAPADALRAEVGRAGRQEFLKGDDRNSVVAKRS
jgi:hypothetical protein